MVTHSENHARVERSAPDFWRPVTAVRNSSK
jgi:hypothetical protein